MTNRTATNLGNLIASVEPALSVTSQGIQVRNETALRGKAIDLLAHSAALAQDEATKEAARWIIREAAQAVGIVPASIHGLYEAMGRGEVEGFTVPAVNLHGITYGIARTLAKSAIKIGCGALIFEISASEICYSDHRPAEYAAAVLAGLIKEGFKGPAFIQGDLFQVKAARYRKDRDAEIARLEAITKEAVEAGFYNIDIDASTLVDLSKDTVDEQQADNHGVTAEMIEWIRTVEPTDITVSVGGEIGEVGNKDSTVEELVSYMDGLLRTLKPGRAPVSKISVQTGTIHGGVVLPDGAVAQETVQNRVANLGRRDGRLVRSDEGAYRVLSRGTTKPGGKDRRSRWEFDADQPPQVEVDFDRLEELSQVARVRYGLCGVVQHAASTLPDETFDNFPKCRTAELHLATRFQNIVYDHPAFPQDIKNQIYAYLKEQHDAERQPSQADEHVLYKTGKMGWSRLKERFWALPADRLGPILEALEKKFDLFLAKLNVANTAPIVAKYVQTVPVHAPMPEALSDHLN